MYKEIFYETDLSQSMKRIAKTFKTLYYHQNVIFKKEMQHLKSALCQIIFFRVFPDVKVAVLSVLHILS